MKKTKIKGWLFDVDELGSGVALWIYDAGGKLHRLTHEFSPPIYVSGARDDLKRLSSDLWRRRFVTGGRWEKRREFWTGEEIEVLTLSRRTSISAPRVLDRRGDRSPATQRLRLLKPFVPARDCRPI